MNLLYLIGIPGAGKTTLLRDTMAGCDYTSVYKPIPYIVWPGGVEMGVRRGMFSGTDGCSMSVQTAAIRWLNACPFVHVMGEGDRLGNASFFGAAKRLGVNLSVVLLDTPAEIAACRREKRGTEQKASWVAGRATKVNNLRPYVDPDWILDGSRPVSELVEQLQQHPVIQAMRGEVREKQHESIAETA